MGRLPRRCELLTQGHANGSLVLAALADDVVDGPVEAVDDDGRGRAAAGKDLDGDDVGRLGDAVGGAGDGAGDVGAVALGIGVATADGVVAEAGARAELVVRRQEARVDDVGPGAGAGRRVVDVRGRAGATVGDCAQAPGGARLGRQGARGELGGRLLLLGRAGVVEVVNLVLLYLEDLFCKKKTVSQELNHIYHEAIGEGALAHVGVVLDLLNSLVVKLADVGVEVLNMKLLLNAAGVAAREAALVHVAGPGHVGVKVLDALLESDDVLVGDDLAFMGRSSLGGGRGQGSGQESAQEEGDAAEVGHCQTTLVLVFR